MVETWVIEWVKEAESETGVDYHVAIRMADGRKLLRVFNDDVLEWRAAEYGLDAEKDFDEILDLHLHEAYIPDPTHPDNFENDEAGKNGKTAPAVRSWGRRVNIGDEVPMHCYNAPSAQEAREAHKMRVEAVKRDRVQIIPPQVSLLRGVKKPDDPLDLIRQNRVLDPELCEMKKAHVEETRASGRVRAEQARRGKANLFLAVSSSRITTGRVIGRPIRPVVTPVPYDETVDRRDEDAAEDDEVENESDE